MTIYPINVVLFTCISNTTLIIKCPLSPHKLRDNNPCPTKMHPNSLWKTIPHRYQHWKSDNRAPPSPSLLIIHFQTLLRAYTQCEGPISADGQLFQREIEKKNPTKYILKKKQPPNQMRTINFCWKSGVQCQGWRKFPLPSLQGFHIFQGFFSMFIPSVIVLATEKQSRNSSW